MHCVVCNRVQRLILSRQTRYLGFRFLLVLVGLAIPALYSCLVGLVARVLTDGSNQLVAFFIDYLRNALLFLL